MVLLEPTLIVRESSRPDATAQAPLSDRRLNRRRAHVFEGFGHLTGRSDPQPAPGTYDR